MPPPGEQTTRPVSQTAVVSVRVSHSYLQRRSGRLSRYFGNSAQFWMNLQTRYDLVMTERDMGDRIDSEVEHAA